ncbi:MAG TPA: hypothetical protein VID27_03425, partial [Blastocatellia bacterium]
ALAVASFPIMTAPDWIDLPVDSCPMERLAFSLAVRARLSAASTTGLDDLLVEADCVEVTGASRAPVAAVEDVTTRGFGSSE